MQLIAEKAIAPTWTRTKNLMIKSHLLYQLSYRGRAAGILLSVCPGFKRRGGVDWKPVTVCGGL